MALLGYSFAFLVLLAIAAWIVFPRLIRFLALALLVFVGAAVVLAGLDNRAPPREDSRQ